MACGMINYCFAFFTLLWYFIIFFSVHLLFNTVCGKFRMHITVSK